MNKFIFLTAAALIVPASLLSAEETQSRRSGNVEIVETTAKGKIASRIIYTYEGVNKIRGEYWIAADPEKKNEKKTNIFAGTAAAAYYEKMLAGSKTKDDSGIEVNIEKDGFILSSVKTAAYDKAGHPLHVAFRGFSTYPVAGTFNLKTDWIYTYDANGYLMSVTEKNMNVDSLMLNMGVENITKITRGELSRPVKVTRILGSVPPSTETTEYEYDGSSSNMAKTVYHQCSFDLTKLKAVPSKTITSIYGSDVPWDGFKKYDFSFGKIIKGFSIFDETEKKQILDGANFMSMSFISKGMFLKNIVTYYRNEQKGPKWRMGELPDVPDPFMIHKDFKWYE